MSTEQQQIRIDSTAWTGEFSSAPKPTLRKLPPNASRNAVMAVVCIFALFVGLAIDRMPVAATGDYVLTTPFWHEALALCAVGAGFLSLVVALLLGRTSLPQWSNRLCLMVAAILLLAAATDYGLVVQAHRAASLVSAVEPMLLANSDGCGTGRYRRPQPCVHSFRVMDRSGKVFLVEGYGKATARACILVQKLSDGSGFVWYRRSAYYDLLPTIGAHDFTPDIGDRCLRRAWRA